MLLRRLMEHVRSENWFVVSLDLLVVVVGLFIGLQIDQWWEGQKESRLESVYLMEIREDFEANKLSLEQEILKSEETIRDMVTLHAQSSLPEPSLSYLELNTRFASITRMPTFVITRRAYDNLTGSGELKFVRNRPLKNALADYYAAAVLTAVVQTTHEMELVQTFLPYIIENLDYAAVKRDYVDDFPLGAPTNEAQILEELATQKFRNTVVQKWVITADLLDQFRGMMERTDEVLAMLE
jgi:hypothetical protein